MENGIEDLVTSTILKIKKALDNDKPGEAKVYAETLVLLRQAASGLPPNWAYNKTGRVDMNKPFEKISEKHIPDA